MSGGDAVLHCICGALLSHETIKLTQDGGEWLEVECGNPLCTIRRVAYLQEVGGKIRLRLAKMVKEFNMLLMGYEEVERMEKRMSRKIEDSLLRRFNGEARRNR